MLDAQELEEKLDRQLSKETPETLAEYLYQKRYKQYLTTAKTPVTYEVFKIIRRQIEILEEQLGPRWYFGGDQAFCTR